MNVSILVDNGNGRTVASEHTRLAQDLGAALGPVVRVDVAASTLEDLPKTGWLLIDTSSWRAPYETRGYSETGDVTPLAEQVVWLLRLLEHQRVLRSS